MKPWHLRRKLRNKPAQSNKSLRIIQLLAWGLLASGLVLLIYGSLQQWQGVRSQVSHGFWLEFVLQNYSNFSAELISVSITVLLIDRLYRTQDRRDRVLHLTSLAVSKDAQVSKNAVQELLAGGNFQDGLLEGANLAEVDFHDIGLPNSRLASAYLVSANFSGSILFGSDLSWANCGDVDFSNSSLARCNLVQGFFHRANFELADLVGAQVALAEFTETNLRGATISPAQLASLFSLWGSIMPNGSKYNGRFNLPGDAEYYKNISSKKVIAIHDFYGVSKKAYEWGQKWNKIFGKGFSGSIPKKYSQLAKSPDTPPR